MSLTNLKDKAEMVLITSITGLGWKGGFWDAEDEDTLEEIIAAVDDMYRQMMVEIVGDIIPMADHKLPAVVQQRVLCLNCNQQPIEIATFMLMQENIYRVSGLTGQFITFCPLCDENFIFRFSYPANWHHGTPIVVKNLKIEQQENQDGSDSIE